MAAYDSWRLDFTGQVGTVEAVATQKSRLCQRCPTCDQVEAQKAMSHLPRVDPTRVGNVKEWVPLQQPERSRESGGRSAQSRGCPSDTRPLHDTASLRAIAAGLEERGIPAARGGKWSAVQVSRLLEAAVPFDASGAIAVE